MAIKTLTTIFRLANNQIFPFLHILEGAIDGYFQ
jgi:hypothetical protein